jgi:hypothetical protein
LCHSASPALVIFEMGSGCNPSICTSGVAGMTGVH